MNPKPNKYSSGPDEGTFVLDVLDALFSVGMDLVSSLLEALLGH